MQRAESKRRWIAVDDTDSSIAYDGPWFQGNATFENLNIHSGPTYLGTLHGLNGTGSLSFPFEGSSIEVTGTQSTPYDLSRIGTLTNTWKCLIDGETSAVNGANLSGEIEPYAAVGNYVHLCSWEGQDGPHNLTIVVKYPDLTFWLDQIQYLPSLNARVENPMVLVPTVDSAIEYGAGWETRFGGEMITRAQHAYITVAFTGTRLTWWGYIIPEPPMSPSLATYYLNAGLPVDVILSGDSKEDFQHERVILQTPVLSSRGPHTFYLTYEGNGSAIPLGLTNFLMEDGDLISPNPYGILSTGSNTTASSPTNPTESPTTASANNSSNSLPVGLTVGLVLGGVLVISAVVAFVYRFRMRAKTRSNSVKPFFVPGALPSTSIFRKEQKLPPETVSNAPQSSTILIHEDSGARFQGQLVEFPPVYTPA